MRGKIVGLCHAKGVDKETSQPYEYIRFMCTYSDKSNANMIGDNVYGGYVPEFSRKNLLEKYPDLKSAIGKTVIVDFTPKGRISGFEIM